MDWVAERAGFESSRPLILRILTLNGAAQAYRRPTGFSLNQSDVCLPAKELTDMKHKAFKRGNRKPGGRTQRSIDASGKELLR